MRIGRGSWVLFLGLALMLTWPMAADPFSTVPGHPEASVGCHLWVIWWAQHHLGVLETDLLFFPYGADVVQLYGSDVLSPLILGWMPMSPAVLYNSWVLVLLMVGALGVERLCLQLGATKSGAVLGAVVFECAPFFQHELLNGTTEMLAAGVLPWFAWALIRLLDNPHRKHGLILGAVVALGTAASAYNLFFMVLLGTVLVVHRLSTRLEPVLTKSTWSALGWGALVNVPVGTALAWLHTSHGASELYERRSTLDEMGMVLPDSYASVDAWLSPRPISLPVVMQLPDGSDFDYWTTCTVFLGLVSLSIGLWTIWSRKSLGPMGVLAIVAALIAMGPFLRVSGTVVDWGVGPISLPTLVLADMLPPFRVTALHAYRYAVLVVLSLAVLVSQATRWRSQVAWGVGALIVIESLFLSPVPWPARTTTIPDSPTLNALAESPSGAVLHVPMRADDLGELGSMLVAQTIHGHPVHDGGIHHRAGEDATVLSRDFPALSLLSSVGERRLPDPIQSAWTLKELYLLGYRYVLVSASDEEGRHWASRSLGLAVEEDPHWVLWRIEPGTLEP